MPATKIKFFDNATAPEAQYAAGVGLDISFIWSDGSQHDGPPSVNANFKLVLTLSVPNNAPPGGEAHTKCALPTGEVIDFGTTNWIAGAHHQRIADTRCIVDSNGKYVLVIRSEVRAMWATLIDTKTFSMQPA